MSITSTVGLVVVTIAGLIFLSLLSSYPLMLLWNGCLVPAIPGVQEVSWLQMWGLNILCGLLFKTSLTKVDK